jgi:Leucine-rich repeat (LRR) protein
MNPYNTNIVFFIKILIILIYIQLSNKMIVSIKATSLASSQGSLVTTQLLNECNWEFNKTNHMICNIRTLEPTTSVDLLQDAEGISNLDIVCSDSIFYESQLQKNLFRKLQSVNELTIDSCKLLKLQNNIFEGLYGLKKLKINTKNTQWATTKSLETFPGSMSGLKELMNLELIDSNIRLIADGFYCPLNNLQVLNLTRNRIRSTENLGFSTNSFLDCGGAALQELQTLDLSYNELTFIPENWAVSKLRRLQQLNLQHNNISELNGETLAGLNSLRILNLSYNHLEQLPSTLFYGSRELREIYLQNNELYELPHGLFHRLEQLLILDLSQNQLTSHHIDNGTFAGLIRLIVLNLSHNALTKIDSKTFRELYFLQILNLRNNSIGYIDDNAFLPLYNLHTLNLAENRLHTLNDKLFNGLYVLSKLTLNNNLISIVEQNVFKNCSDLKELDLSSNQLQDVPEALKDLAMLRTLDLGENQITHFSAAAFKSMNQLTGLRLIDNQIENITKGMFDNLPRLNVLNLSKNRIQSIERGSFDKNREIEAIRLDGNFVADINGIFSTLTSLLWLNLAENHLVWFDYAFVPKNLKWLDIHSNYIESLGNYYKIQEEIRIKTLDASHNRLAEIGPMSVPNSVELLFINNNHISKIHTNTFIDKANLVRVDMYANALTKLQLHQLRISPSIGISAEQKYPNQQQQPIPEFYLGGNPLECDCNLEWLQRINNFTSRQYPRIMDLPNIECIMPHARGATIRPIQQLDVSEFLCSYETHCFALCNCCDFEGCECDMTCPTNCSCYHDQTWSTNMIDCGKQSNQRFPARIPADATEIYLDGNNYPELDIGLFRQHNKLRSLYLNASQIEVIRNRTFFGLTSLQIIHLEDNLLQKLYGYEFEHLIKLREIYLQNNRLSLIGNQTFAHLKSLQILHIDGNRLVNVMLWQMLPPLFASNYQSNPMMNNLQEISIGRNPWSCRCRFLQDLTQFVVENAIILQDSQDIYCVENDGSGEKRELDFNSTSVCSDYFAGSSSGLPNLIIFNDYMPLVITLLAMFCLLLLLAILIIFREPLRLWLFSHYGVRVFGPPCEDSEKLYDAVFLHSAKDTEFIMKNITNELEIPNGRASALRVCLQHRDLAEDASYIQLLETVCASRRIIILLNRNFLQTEWTRYDLRRAIHESLRGRPHKLVIIEDIDVLLEAESDIELLPYLKTSAVNRIRRTDKHFWEKLRYAIPVEVSLGNNYTLTNHPQTLLHHEHIKHRTLTTNPMNGGIVYHQKPPAYCADMDEANYSSCTTATPSPKISRHMIATELQQINSQPNHHHFVVASPSQQAHNHNQRPPSEHIYSSIDSDYSTLDCENLQMVEAQFQQNQSVPINIIPNMAAHRAAAAGTWRNSNVSTNSSNNIPNPNGHHVQAYLV